MLGLLLVGSVGFWIIMAVECALLLALIEFEKPGWGFFSIVAVIAGLKFFGDFDLIAEVRASPKMAVIFALGYLAAGATWAFIKWFFYVRRRREDYLEAKLQYTPTPDRNNYHDDTKLVWEKSYERKKFLNSKGELPPLARDNKNRIILWMSYWPWSACWTLINDPIKRAFRFIYEQIHASLQKISDHAFKGVE